jgi:transcriptional antiterminator NusG
VWVEETMPLLPGYLIAVTEDPWCLLDQLRGISEFTKLLPTGKTFAPLDEEEKSWIEKWTKEGNRIIPMSYAYKEGEKLVITEGPLMGKEALIVRVNRRKSVAHLEIHAGVITIHTTVGLNILPSKPM